MELPRDFMARCAQRDDRAIFEHRPDLIAGHEDLRYVGFRFADAAAARAWDDRPGNLVSWWTFVSWDEAQAWLAGSPVSSPPLAWPPEGL